MPRAARAWLGTVGDGADGGADVRLAHVVVRGVRRRSGGRSHGERVRRAAAARGTPAAQRCVCAHRGGSGAHNEVLPSYRRGCTRQARPSRAADARARLIAPLAQPLPTRACAAARSPRCRRRAARPPRPWRRLLARRGALWRVPRGGEPLRATCRRMSTPPQRAPLLLDLRTRLRLSLAATMAVRLRCFALVARATRRAVTLFGGVAGYSRAAAAARPVEPGAWRSNVVPRVATQLSPRFCSPRCALFGENTQASEGLPPSASPLFLLGRRYDVAAPPRDADADAPADAADAAADAAAQQQARP